MRSGAAGIAAGGISINGAVITGATAAGTVATAGRTKKGGADRLRRPSNIPMQLRLS